jgi:hypothetical protein
MDITKTVVKRNEASIRLTEDGVQCQTMQNRAIHVGCYKTQPNFPPAEQLLVPNRHCSMQIVSTELHARPGTPGRTAPLKPFNMMTFHLPVYYTPQLGLHVARSILISTLFFETTGKYPN